MTYDQADRLINGLPLDTDTAQVEILLFLSLK